MAENEKEGAEGAQKSKVPTAVVEIMEEYDIPKGAGFEGLIGYLADNARKEAKANGITDKEGLDEVSKNAAALVAPDEVPERARELAGMKSHLEFHEKRLVMDAMRMKADRTGERGIFNRKAEDLQKDLGEIIEAGGFKKQIERIARVKNLSIVEATKTVTLTGNPSLVATMYLADYIRERTLLSGYREHAMIVPMGGTESAQVPKVTAEPTAEEHAEGVALTAQDVSIGNVQLNLTEVAVMTKVSNRSLAKSIGNFEELVGRILGIQTRRKMDTRYGTGNGTSAPRGITNFSISKTVAVQGELDYLHILAALNTLGDEYMDVPEETGLIWIGNQGGKEALMGVRDQVGRPLWTMLDGSNFNTFRAMGIPFVNLPGISGTGNSGDATTLYLSAHRLACYIGDGEDETLRVDDSRFSDELNTAFIYSVTDDAEQADAAATVSLTEVEKAA